MFNEIKEVALNINQDNLPDKIQHINMLLQNIQYDNINYKGESCTDNIFRLMCKSINGVQTINFDETNVGIFVQFFHTVNRLMSSGLISHETGKSIGYIILIKEVSIPNKSVDFVMSYYY
jgi:hypothetical protein